MDNKNNFRGLLIYLGIPVIMLIVIAFLFNSQPKEEHTYSEIVGYFEDMRVKEFKADASSGELNLTILDSDKEKTINYTVASITMLMEKIDPYIEKYNEGKKPEERLSYEIILCFGI